MYILPESTESISIYSSVLLIDRDVTLDYLAMMHFELGV